MKLYSTGSNHEAAKSALLAGAVISVAVTIAVLLVVSQKEPADVYGGDPIVDAGQTQVIAPELLTDPTLSFPSDPPPDSTADATAGTTPDQPEETDAQVTQDQQLIDQPAQLTQPLVSIPQQQSLRSDYQPEQEEN